MQAEMLRVCPRDDQNETTVSIGLRHRDGLRPLQQSHANPARAGATVADTLMSER